jgi:hypothetical protein
MKTPRIADFDPDAKIHTLKSSLDNMPVIGKPTHTPLLENPIIQTEQSNQPTPKRPNGRIPVPRPVRGTVPPTVPLIPKVKRLIRQRQPFDIYEDQYERLKKIAESEREFVNGRGMSRMVREAIDNYLRDYCSSKE